MKSTQKLKMDNFFYSDFGYTSKENSHVCREISKKYIHRCDFEITYTQSLNYIGKFRVSFRVCDKRRCKGIGRLPGIRSKITSAEERTRRLDLLSSSLWYRGIYLTGVRKQLWLRLIWIDERGGYTRLAASD